MKMREIILDFPKQFKTGLKSAENVAVKGKFDAILICGMGASAFPGAILKTWMESRNVKLPVYLHQEYGLPHWADRNHLIICASYSGNTEEVISSFKKAREKKLKIVGITSGGELAKLCQKHKLPVALVPSGLPPRMALGLPFAALVKILANSKIIKNELKNIASLEKRLKPETLESQGRNLSKKLKKRIPVIYSSSRMEILVQMWKLDFNENSKIPAFSNSFPAVNHGEMAGFTRPLSDFSVLILKDSADYSRNLKRMGLTSKLLRKKRIPVEFIDIKGEDILEKIFRTKIIGDWASYFLAKEYGVDPISVKMVKDLKENLKRGRGGTGRRI